jgi:type I restriction-modification system DNA methylase subunit
MELKTLVLQKQKLDVAAVAEAIVEKLGVSEKVNWNAVLPKSVQQSQIGGETLRLIADHPQLAGVHDIRTLCLLKGTTSQLLFMFVRLKDHRLRKTDIERITRKFIGGQEAGRYIVWLFADPKDHAIKIIASGKERRKVTMKTLTIEAGEWYLTYDLVFNLASQKFAQGGLFKQPEELWKAIWESFDITIVNREFFKSIKIHFDSLIGVALSTPRCPLEGQDAKVQFAIRLIGRLLFCWFLKKKGIVHDVVLSSKAVEANGAYYRTVLEPLFFDVFNTPKAKRKKLSDTIKDYPFLNGGLFEAQEDDHVRNVLLTIPNEWFHDLFAKTLERFNFTVDESSSANEEIAVDPEMLGRIFENLLAEQNEETKKTARNETGSFYTPRQIVDFQVEESIAYYLEEQLGHKGNGGPIIAPQQGELFGKPKTVPQTMLFDPHQKAQAASGPEADPEVQKAIRDFVHNPEDGLPKKLQPFSEKMEKALASVKVLDPACGSGAYPMGMLQKLIALKAELAPAQKRQAKNFYYQLKLQTLSQSIYGVDIQPMAVELSRLRAWLSLVIDEEGEPEALPNLDFKFLAADTLIHLSKDAEVMKALGARMESTTELLELRQKHFRATEEEKKRIESRFGSLQIKIATDWARWKSKDKKHEAAFQVIVNRLTEWRPFKNLTATWFDPFWMFGFDGFDVVIGNPPYVRIERMSDPKKQEALLMEGYHTFEKTGDIYCLFYERGTELLGDQGILCFITSNSWDQTKYGRSLRKYFLDFSNPLLWVKFNNTQMFHSAIVETSILITRKERYRQQCMAVSIGDEIDSDLSLPDFVHQHSMVLEELSESGWIVLDASSLARKKQFDNVGKKLGDWNVEINYGIKTGLNKAFIIDGDTYDNLVKVDAASSKIIKRTLSGRNLKRYSHKFSGNYIIATLPAWKLNIDDYPSIREYLQKIGVSRLEQKGEPGGRKKTNNKWFEVQDTVSCWREFEKPKIIWGELSDDAKFTYDDDGFYVDNTMFVLTGNQLKYLIGVLNSKAAKWYFDLISTTSGMGTNRWLKHKIVLLPVPVPTAKQEAEIEGLVDQVLAMKKAGQPSQVQEDKIDALVWGLYGVGANEIEHITSKN